MAIATNKNTHGQKKTKIGKQNFVKNFLFSLGKTDTSLILRFSAETVLQAATFDHISSIDSFSPKDKVKGYGK